MYTIIIYVSMCIAVLMHLAAKQMHCSFNNLYEDTTTPLLLPFSVEGHNIFSIHENILLY